VARVGSSDIAAQRQALADLLTRYAPAIRSYLRFARGMGPHDADDLLQGFLVGKVLEDRIILRAQNEKGRFRSFLLMALDHYIISEWRADHRRKKGGDCWRQSLDDAQDLTEPRADPAGMFDIAWARELLSQAVRNMREECRRKKRPDLWGLFFHRVLAEVRGDPRRLSYQTLITRYKIQSPAQANNLLATAKRMFARTLTTTIAEYESEQDITDEIRELTRILAEASR